MLGKILKDSRKLKELTLAQLAEKVGVTTGYISQLERDIVEPSLSVLRKLSDILDIPISMLFAKDNSAEDVVVIRKSERNRIRYSNLANDCEVLVPIVWRSNNAPEIDVIQMDIPPNSITRNDNMSYDSDECIFVLEGELEYCYGDKSISISKGGSIYIPKNTGHYICNNTNSTATIIWVSKSNIKKGL